MIGIEGIIERGNGLGWEEKRQRIESVRMVLSGDGDAFTATL